MQHRYVENVGTTNIRHDGGMIPCRKGDIVSDDLFHYAISCFNVLKCGVSSCSVMMCFVNSFNLLLPTCRETERAGVFFGTYFRRKTATNSRGKKKSSKIL